MHILQTGNLKDRVLSILRMLFESWKENLGLQ